MLECGHGSCMQLQGSIILKWHIYLHRKITRSLSGNHYHHKHANSILLLFLPYAITLRDINKSALRHAVELLINWFPYYFEFLNFASLPWGIFYAKVKIIWRAGKRIDYIILVINYRVNVVFIDLRTQLIFTLPSFWKVLVSMSFSK